MELFGMMSRMFSGFLVVCLIVAGLALVAGAAGCNCDQTCTSSHWFCEDEGEGNCHQFFEHRCNGSTCGPYEPWKGDCMYTCDYTIYYCLFGGKCEDITWYYSYCL